MKKLIATLGVVTLLTAGSAIAMDNTMSQSDTDHMNMMVDKEMKMMDTNGDGMISKEEHEEAAEKMFKDADTNHDGKLSKQEMMDMKMKHMQDMGMMKDGMMNKNGMMSK